MVTLTLLEQWSGCNAVGQTQKSCISHSQPGTEDLGPFLPSSLEEETANEGMLSPTQCSQARAWGVHPDHSACALLRGGCCQVQGEAAKAGLSPFPFSPAAVTAVL